MLENDPQRDYLICTIFKRNETYGLRADVTLLWIVLSGNFLAALCSRGCVFVHFRVCVFTKQGVFTRQIYHSSVKYYEGCERKAGEVEEERRSVVKLKRKKGMKTGSV